MVQVAKILFIQAISLIIILMKVDKNADLSFLKFPELVCAPMVDQSQLPFRLLCRRYGCTLAYTPMLHSKMMTTQKHYKKTHFTTCPEDRPLVAQLCGNDPETMLKAAKMVEDQVDAIDINFGCPQGIARRGNYGSFLLQQPDIVVKLIETLSQNLKVPLFCKIRILKTEEKTMELVQRIVKAGCKLLTVHGRTKEQNKEKVGSCDWSMIKKIKDAIDIPVFANGGIFNFADVDRCLAQTNVDGVMSAQALLENPALFSGKIVDLDNLALEYLALAEQHPGAEDSCIRAHMFKLMFTGLSKHIDLRERLTKARGLENFRQIVMEMIERRKDVSPDVKIGWYLRYWKNNPYRPPAIEEEKPQEEKKEGEEVAQPEPAQAVAQIAPPVAQQQSKPAQEVMAQE